MTLTDIIFTILAGILAIGVWTLYGYIKKLPDRLHQYALTKSEYGMKAELEEFRASLLRDLELAKISQSELQLHKTKEFMSFTTYFNEILTRPDRFAQLERDSKKHAVFKQKMLDLGGKLYFFGSDETIRAYLEFRRVGSGNQTHDSRIEILRTYGRLMLQMRRDLGYSDTCLNEDDFLRLIIVDWDEHVRAL